MRDRIRQLTSPSYLTQLALALRYTRGSCSQEGEDLLLERFYLLPDRGTYIDIGAGHPFRWSNTARLYRKGWSGTVVEPNPSRAALLRRFRRRDRVIQAVVGAPEPTVVVAMYEDPNYNTIDRDLVAQRAARGLRPISEIEAQSMALHTIQTETAAATGKPISLICVDTEGSDLSVLESGTWDDGPLRPIIVIAEILDVAEIRALVHHPVVEFLESQDYLLSSRLKESAIFIDRKRSAG